MKTKLDVRIVEPPEFVRFAGFLLDIGGCTLTGLDGREIPLRSSEFTLLLAFIRAPGRVLSRDHLLNVVAGHQSSPYDRSIDVLVSRLRHKIEADPKLPNLIVTVPGLGYKFAASPQTGRAVPEIRWPGSIYPPSCDRMRIQSRCSRSRTSEVVRTISPLALGRSSSPRCRAYHLSLSSRQQIAPMATATQRVTH
jgi:DNA-binding winged helix-turn-helix (wHTH) protein